MSGRCGSSGMKTHGFAPTWKRCRRKKKPLLPRSRNRFPNLPGEAEPEPSAAPAAPASSELELAAYRRAEAAERSARSRAASLCRQVNEIVEHAAQQFSASRSDVDALMSDLNICLRRLNDTFAELRITFDDTAAAFSAVDTLQDPRIIQAPGRTSCRGAFCRFRAPISALCAAGTQPVAGPQPHGFPAACSVHPDGRAFMARLAFFATLLQTARR